MVQSFSKLREDTQNVNIEMFCGQLSILCGIVQKLMHLNVEVPILYLLFEISDNTSFNLIIIFLMC